MYNQGLLPCLRNFYFLIYKLAFTFDANLKWFVWCFKKLGNLNQPKWNNIDARKFPKHTLTTTLLKFWSLVMIRFHCVIVLWGAKKRSKTKTIVIIITVLISHRNCKASKLWNVCTFLCHSCTFNRRFTLKIVLHKFWGNKQGLL